MLRKHLYVRCSAWLVIFQILRCLVLNWKLVESENQGTHENRFGCRRVRGVWGVTCTTDICRKTLRRLYFLYRNVGAVVTCKMAPFTTMLFETI